MNNEKEKQKTLEENIFGLVDRVDVEEPIYRQVDIEVLAQSSWLYRQAKRRRRIESQDGHFCCSPSSRSRKK